MNGSQTSAPTGCRGYSAWLPILPGAAVMLLVALLTATTSLAGPVGAVDGMPSVAATATPPATFAAPLRVDTGPDNLESTDPSLAVDHEGKVHIVWTGARPRGDSPDGLGLEVYYSRELEVGVFSTPISITVPTDYHSRHPMIVIDPQGAAHIVFRRGVSQSSVSWDDDIYYVNNVGGAFAAPQRIVDGKASGSTPSPLAPAIAIGPTGLIHVAFLSSPPGGSSVYYMNNGGRGFSKPLRVSSPVGYPERPLLELDSRGWPHIAFLGDMTLGATSHVYYVKPTADPGVAPAFAAPRDVSRWPRDNQDVFPGFTLDAFDTAHFFFRDPFNTPYAYDEGGVWCVSLIGDALGEPEQVGGSFAPLAAADPDGGVHLIYRAGDHLYYRNNLGGSFHGPQVRAAAAKQTPGGFSALMTGYRPLAAGPDRTLHLVYFNPIVDFHIYYVRGNYTDDPPDPPSPPPTPNPAAPVTGWQRELIAQVDGTPAALALDSTGRPHVAYIDRSAGTIVYARRTGAAWETETIGPAYTSAQIALRLDGDDQPHVAYHVWDVSPFSRIVYARREGAAWRKFPLERAGQAHMSTHVALAVGRDGAAHLVFDDTNDPAAPIVRYAAWNGASWTYERVVAPYARGIHLSLQLGPDGQPRVAYCGGGGTFDFSGLGYAVRGADGWVTDQFGGGAFCSLALDAAGAPRISSAATSGRGQINFHAPGATGWLRTVVASNSLGGATSLALDAAGQPRIAYYAADYHDLMYADQLGDRWRIKPVEFSWQETGYSASLALDAAGHPHIVAFTKGKNELVYWNFTPALHYLPMVLD